VRSTQLIEAFTRTEETTDIMPSSPRRKRRRLFGVLMTQRSGARFTAPWDTIWKSARFFWIERRCHHHQCRCHRIPGELIGAG
jgi:hypothetical protein